MSQYPDQSNPRNTRDKFLVQSFALERELAADDLNALWITKEKDHNPRANRRAYYEHRLKCRLLIPSEELQAPLSGPVSATSPSARSPVIEPAAESGLGIVVSPPLDVVGMEPSTPLTKMPAVPEPAAVAPAEGQSSLAEPPPSTGPPPVPAEKDVRDSAPESQANTAPPLNQPGASAHQEKNTPPTRKKSDAPLLANHPKEYEKMLAYSVKLTVEREALETKLAKLSQHNSFLLQENERLRNALAIEQGVSVAASTASSVNEPKQRSALEALQTSDGRYRPLLEPDFDFSESHANLVASQLTVNSGIQLWQVLAVAALCFLIGRIL